MANPLPINIGHDPLKICKSFIEDLHNTYKNTAGKISVETHRQFISDTITKLTLLGSVLEFQSTIKQTMVACLDKVDTKLDIVLQQQPTQPVSYRDTLLKNTTPTTSKIPLSFDYGKIKIQHPSGSTPDAIKRSLQTKFLAKLPNVRVLRVFPINDSTCTVHFYPATAHDEILHNFNTICSSLNMQLKQHPKNIIIHNVPVEPSTFELVSEDLKAQNISINSVRWLSEKNIKKFKKTHSSIVIDVTTVAQYQQLSAHKSIILLNDFRKIENFDFNHRRKTPTDPSQVQPPVDPTAIV